MKGNKYITTTTYVLKVPCVATKQAQINLFHVYKGGEDRGGEEKGEGEGKGRGKEGERTAKRWHGEHSSIATLEEFTPVQ